MLIVITKEIAQELDLWAKTSISNETILLYFATINVGEYDMTASLFAEKGELYPPFDSCVVGQANIASYLKKEAPGMKLIPKQATEKGGKYQVTGTVQTPLFSVNVCWDFMLDRNQKIASVTIKLLAELKELLSFKKVSENRQNS